MKCRYGVRRATAAALVALLATAVWAAGVDAPPVVRAVETVGYTVSDLDRSTAFFHDVLDFELISTSEHAGEAWEHLEGVFALRVRVARLRLGDEVVELQEYLAPRGRPLPADGRSNDLSFQHVAIVVRDMQAAYARLREHGVGHISPGPQRLPDWNPNAGGIEAFYFRDPDGHALELIAFPAGKGDPRWQAPTDRLFLGIDHTAIGVSDTERSLAFYRDALGLRVAGASENYGPEQERLNGVFGARLRITGLRASRGPGIELLEYLAPRDGRPAPADLRANDLAHWQTTLLVDQAGEAASAVPAGGGRWVSPGAVELPAGEAEFRSGALVRDPDGHAMRLVAR